jgi:hypothetical protein
LKGGIQASLVGGAIALGECTLFESELAFLDGGLPMRDVLLQLKLSSRDFLRKLLVGSGKLAVKVERPLPGRLPELNVLLVLGKIAVL